MKYPLENVSVWDLIRHPFDEESGDPGGRTFMRLLSNIFFPIYVFLQLYVPIQLAMDICLDLGPTGPKIEHVKQVGPPAESAVDQAELLVEQNELTGQRKDPVWLTVMYMFFVWIWLVVGFWTIWVILSSFVRFFTSTYFHKLLIVGFYGALYLCTKKGSPNNIKWNERLDEAMLNLEFVKTEMAEVPDHHHTQSVAIGVDSRNTCCSPTLPLILLLHTQCSGQGLDCPLSNCSAPSS